MLYTYDKIEAKTENFERWKNRCDGKEEVEIDYHHYDLISTLLDDTMTDSEKIINLKKNSGL